jgi:tetratricopeptide (TPR) repeat protein
MVRHGLLALLSGLTAVLGACTSDLSPVQPVLEPVIIRIADSEPLELRLEAATEVPVLITLAARDVDIKAAVVSTSHSVVIYADAPNRRMGMETLLVEPPHDEVMTLRIERNDHRDARGSVRVTAVGLPTATQDDRRRLEAARLEATACLAYPDADRAQDSSEAFLAAAELHRSVGDRLRSGTALLHAAGVQYSRLAGWNTSADLATRARYELREAQAPALSAFAARIQGSALNMVASSDELEPNTRLTLVREGRKQLTTAAEQFQSLGNSYEAGYALNYLGVSYYEGGDRLQARATFRRALRQFEEHGDRPAQALSLQSLAYLDFEDGRLVDAMREFDAALALIPRGEEPVNFAHTLHNSAQPLMVLGRFDEAIARFYDAGRILHDSGDRDGEARALHGMGTALLHAGEIDRARELLQAAINLRQETGVRREQAVSLIVLGRIERDTGNLTAAIDLHRQAAELVTAPNDRARALLALTQDYLAAGERAAARATVTEILGLDLARLHRHRGLALTELGALEALEGHTEESREAFASAIAIHQENGSELELARALHRRADATMARGEISAVLTDTDAALHLFEGVGLAGTQAESRAAFQSSYRGTIELRIAALIRSADAAQALGDHANARQLVKAAFDASDRSRAHLLTENAGNARSNRGVPEQLLTRRREIYDSLAVRRQRQEHYLDQLQPNRQQLTVLEREIALLRTEAALNEARIAGLQSGDTVAAISGAVDLVATIPAGVRVAEFFIGGRHAWRFDIQDGGITVHELPDAGRLRQLARQLHESWRSPGRRTDDRFLLSRQLAEVAFGSLGNSPPPGVLQIVPDGVLHLVPMAVIASHVWTQINAGAVFVVPSLNALYLESQETAEPPRQTIAVIADPVFSLTDPRVHLPTTTLRNLDSADRGAATRTGFRQLAMRRLPAAAAEARAIVDLAELSSGVLPLIGFDASRSRIESASLEEFRVIHFATHAIADSQDPALAMLALSQLDAAGNPIDGTLRSYDIREWRLNADLVVLSGCETALGRELDGEGPMGLSHAFLRSGARSVVASLWKVPDSSTAVLMREFYRQLLVNKQDAPSALLIAQQTIRHQKRWSDPYYWAGFQLVSVSRFDRNNNDVARRGE